MENDIKMLMTQAKINLAKVRAQPTVKNVVF